MSTVAENILGQGLTVDKRQRIFFLSQHFSDPLKKKKKENIN